MIQKYIIFAFFFSLIFPTNTHGFTPITDDDRKITCAQTETKQDSNGNVLSGEGSITKKIQCGTITLGDIPEYIAETISVLVRYLGASSGVIMILYAGYQYIFGEMIEEKEKGKKTFMYALIGVVVTFFSWNIVDWVQIFITQF